MLAVAAFLTVIHRHQQRHGEDFGHGAAFAVVEILDARSGSRRLLFLLFFVQTFIGCLGEPFLARGAENSFWRVLAVAI